MPGPGASNGVEPNTEEETMDLNDVILTVFCLEDDTLKQLQAPDGPRRN